MHAQLTATMHTGREADIQAGRYTDRHALTATKQTVLRVIALRYFAAKDLVTKLLVVDASRRLSAADVQRHAWLNSVRGTMCAMYM